jgi:hypothetical protein
MRMPWWNWIYFNDSLEWILIRVHGSKLFGVSSKSLIWGVYNTQLDQHFYECYAGNAFSKCATLFRASHRPERELGDELRKKNTDIPLSVYWGIFIWIWNAHLKVLDIVGSLKFKWAQAPIVNYPGVWTRGTSA